MHAIPSLQTIPVLGVTAQVAVPLHARVLQVSLVHVMAVPTHVPATQVSVWVHMLPSLQGAVVGVLEQVAVPLHVRVLQVSLVHVMVVPTQVPVLLHLSVCVQAMPSSQSAPVLGVTVHVDVPLHARVLQVSLAHVTVVPAQTPAVHLSPYVQAMPSLHAVVSGAVGFVQAPVPMTHTPATWHWSLGVQALVQQTPPAQMLLSQSPLAMHA